MSIAFEFRTSRTNGVIVAVSNQGRDGLGIEIAGGQVRHPTIFSDLDLAVRGAGVHSKGRTSPSD